MTYEAIVNHVKDLFRRAIDKPDFTTECLRRANEILEDLNDPKSHNFFYNPSSLREQAAKIYTLLDMAGITTSAFDKTGQPWYNSIDQAVTKACIRSVYERLQDLESSNSSCRASHIKNKAVIIQDLLEMAGIATSAFDNTGQRWGKRIELAVVKACLGSVDAKLENLQNTPPNHARAIQYEAKLILELLEVAGIDATATDTKTGQSWGKRIEQTVVEVCLESAEAKLISLESTPPPCNLTALTRCTFDIAQLFLAAAACDPSNSQIAAKEAEAQVRSAAVLTKHAIHGPG